MEDEISSLKELLTTEELSFFNSLAPSYQKNYASYVFDAKTEKTRLKNLDELKEALEYKCKNIAAYKKQKKSPTHKTTVLSDKEKINIYFSKLEDETKQLLTKDIYQQLLAFNEDLKMHYAYNLPMITYNDTFICSFSIFKNHMTFAFEPPIITEFSSEILENNYKLNKKTFSINYNQDINFNLLQRMVNKSIELKSYTTTFWL